MPPLAVVRTSTAGEFLTSDFHRTDWFADTSRPVQLLEQRTDWSRIESPHHYPDNDRVLRSRAAVWIDAVPGYGIIALPLGESGMHAAPGPRAVRVGNDSLENGIVRISVDEGRVSLEMLESGRRIGGFLEFEDRVDWGDLYTPSIRLTHTVPEFTGVEAVEGGPLLGELRLRWHLRDPDHSQRRKPSDVSVYVSLVAESPVVRIRVRGNNRRHNHRLRLGLLTDVQRGAVWADAAFGPVHRVPIELPNEYTKAETPPPTAPLHRYVSLFGALRGATLFSDGLAEYEATDDGRLFVTLLRAVGDLSRSDLPERPGHAGWPAPTPKAQSLGPFAGRFGLLLHGRRDDATVDEIERAADDMLLPLEGRTLRSALTTPPPIGGAELHGAGLAFSALKESEDGGWLVARCVNLLDSPVDGFWRFGFGVNEARIARLDETPGECITLSEDRVPLQAPPRAVITVLVR